MSVTDFDVSAVVGAVRDQGRRPTCLAFATSDAHRATHKLPEPLSVEYLFYHARQRESPFMPHVAATLRQVLNALRVDGQPTEVTWPYLTSLPVDLSAYVPPPNVGTVYRRASEVLGVDGCQIRTELGAARPVVLIFRLSEGFVRASSRTVIAPAPGEATMGLHAVVVVAAKMRQGSWKYRVKNSWGDKWADTGCAWITNEFVSTYGTSIVRMN